MELELQIAHHKLSNTEDALHHYKNHLQEAAVLLGQEKALWTAPSSSRPLAETRLEGKAEEAVQLLTTVKNSPSASFEVSANAAWILNKLARDRLDFETAQKHSRFESCFISHSTDDAEFAGKLCDDLKNAGVRCWLATDNLKPGEKLRERVAQEIELHDRVLLVLSDSSLRSYWVSREVNMVLKREAQEGRNILFPLRLDESILQIKTGWAAPFQQRVMQDFSAWKNSNMYQLSLAQLLGALKAKSG